VEDTTNDAIKALKHLYSVSDISAFGYVKTELPSASVVIEQILTSGTKIAKINGTTIYAPAGGGTTNFAALTLVINGLNEQYIPTGDSKIFDLDAVYAKKGEGGNVNLDDYYKKTEIETLLKGYAKTSDIPTDYVTNDTLATTVNNAIIALNISQYATNSELNTAINGANATAQGYANSALATAKSYADGKFNYASITEALYLTSKNSNDASEFYPAFINMRGSQYAYIDFYTCDDYTTATDYPVRLITSHLEPGVLQLTSGRYGVGTLKIGNAYLTYDSENNALFVKGKDGAPINLVATGDVAAFSGLGSGFDTLTDLTLTNKLTANALNIGNGYGITCEIDKYGDYQTRIDYLHVENYFYANDMKVDYLTVGENIVFSKNNTTIEDVTTGVEDETQYVYITINGTKYKLVATT
jgi:hypothetical protein